MIEAAFALFHAKGVHATGVDEILERSGTGKSQLYHYFGSKDGLIQAVVDDFERRLRDGDLPGTAELRTVADLEAWFGMFLQFQRDTGCRLNCPMATIAAGLSDDQDPIRLAIQRVIDQSRGVLERFFASLIEQKKLPARTSPRELADFCYTIMQGGLLMSKVTKNPQSFEHAVRHAVAHVRSLMR